MWQQLAAGCQLDVCLMLWLVIRTLLIQGAGLGPCTCCRHRSWVMCSCRGAHHRRCHQHGRRCTPSQLSTWLQLLHTLRPSQAACRLRQCLAGLTFRCLCSSTLWNWALAAAGLQHGSQPQGRVRGRWCWANPNRSH